MNCVSYRRALPTLTAGMLLTALPIFAQTGDKPLTLRVKYRQGEVSQYQTTMAISMAPPPGTAAPQGGAAPLQQISVLQQFQTSKVLPDGSAQVLVTTKNMQGGMGATPMPKPVTLTMTPLGVVKSASGSMGKNASNMLNGMLGSNALGTQQFPLPTQAIKPGSSWNNSFSLGPMGTGSLKGQFVKINMVGKQKTALLHYILHMPIKTFMNGATPTPTAAGATMSMSGSVVMNVDNDIDLESGRLLRSTGNGTMAMAISPTNPPKAPPVKAGAPQRPAMPGSMKINTNVTLGTTLVSYTPGGAAKTANR